MFQVHNWPTVILHLDGDAFFSSVFQAVNPALKGKPVVTGSERGLATAVSYEARKLGISRGMLTWQIKKICPSCIILPSDYELYGLFSKKMFSIMREFSPEVEEYSIDEGFADIKGMRRPLNMSYFEIGSEIKDKIENSLGISVSVGISLTKSLAKLASSFRKPSSLIVVDGKNINKLLQETALENVWGIGGATSSYLKKFKIKTAFDFANLPETFIKKNLTKPFFEIWQELRGIQVYQISVSEKTTYQSITRSRTFSPSTNNPDILWAKLLQHIEDAFYQARLLHYKVGRVIIFLKTQDFDYHAIEIKLQEKTGYPLLIREELRKGFQQIYQKGFPYRSTGATITHLDESGATQATLFHPDSKFIEKVKKIYPLYEAKKVDFGTSFLDKQTVSENKPKPKLKLPVISI